MDSHRGYIPFVNGWYTGSGSTAVIIGPSSLRHKCHRRTPRQVSSWGSSIYNVSIAVDASEFQLDSLNTILYPGSSMTPWILHWLYRWVAIEVLCNAATPLPLQAPHPRLHQYSPRLHHFNSRPYTMLGFMTINRGHPYNIGHVTNLPGGSDNPTRLLSFSR